MAEARTKVAIADRCSTTSQLLAASESQLLRCCIGQPCRRADNSSQCSYARIALNFPSALNYPTLIKFLSPTSLQQMEE